MVIYDSRKTHEHNEASKTGIFLTGEYNYYAKNHGSLPTIAAYRDGRDWDQSYNAYCDGERWKPGRGKRDLEQENRLLVICDRLCGGSGQRVAIPVPVLQERRGYVSLWNIKCLF